MNIFQIASICCLRVERKDCQILATFFLLGAYALPTRIGAGAEFAIDLVCITQCASIRGMFFFVSTDMFGVSVNSSITTKFILH